MVLPLLTGYNKQAVVAACDRTDPTLCSNAAGARTIHVKQVCADPTLTTLVAGAPLVMTTTSLMDTSVGP
jgi:hypothetical protein